MIFLPPGVTTRNVACPSQVILRPLRFMGASFPGKTGIVE
jgi:hypothetical protein